MKLLLGIFSKKSKPDPNEFSAMLEDFSLSGKRKIPFKIIGKLLIASYDPSGTDPEPLVASMNGSSKLFLGGHIYNLNKLAEIFSFSKGVGLSELPQYFANNAEKFLSAANGMFSLVHYNTDNHELIIANDTFGLYPLFLYEDEDYFIFSNEFEPIIRYKYFNNALDQDAIAEYFALGSPIAGKTFFKKIRNLLPATILTINAERITQKHYELPKIAINYAGNTDLFAEQIASVFHEAVQSRVAINGKKSCMLTGGLDTRFIVSNLSKEQREAIDFITFITPGLTPGNDKDVMIAKMIAEKLSLKHTVMEYRPWSIQWKEDFDLNFFDIWREHYHELTFAGVYGGEFLSGVCFGIIPPETMNYSARRDVIINLFKKKRNDLTPIKILNKDFLENVRNPYETLKDEINNIPAENKELFFAIEYLTRGFHTRIYGGLSALFANSYTYPTKVLTPFLDKEYLNVLLSIPQNVLTDEKQTLYNSIYKNYFSELNNIPTSNKAFTKTASNCIRFFEEGKEAKNERIFKNSKSIIEYLKNEDTWKKNFYNKDLIIKIAGNGYKKDIESFFDFESWYNKYYDRK